MVLPQLKYLAPKTIGEIYNLLLELRGPVKVMAGTTDLIPSTRDKAISPECLIDLKKIPDLDYLEYDEEERLKIGALTILCTIETSSLVKEEGPAVVHAAKVMASTQIRARGIMMEDICNASPSCDTAPNFLIQGTKILAQGSNKDRIAQAEGFFLGVKKTSLGPREIITGIVTPPLAENERAAYIKHAVRKAMDPAIIDIAVRIKMEDGICTDAHIVLDVVATTPIRALKAGGALIGEALVDEAIVKVLEEAMDSCHPISDIRASAEYRKDMVRVFTERAVRQAMECSQRGQENEAQYKFNRQRRLR